MFFKPCLQFEYQQAQLEAEVENLSWKIERAEITDRGVCRLHQKYISSKFKVHFLKDLENQMDIAEKRRLILVKDFLEAWPS